MEERVAVTRSEYLGLRKAADKLGFLEAGGVDNWEGYGTSLYPDDEEQENIKQSTEKIEAEVAAMPAI